MADTLVLKLDPDAKGANMFYWYRIEPFATLAAAKALSSDDPAIATPADALLRDPTRLELHGRLSGVVGKEN